MIVWLRVRLKRTVLLNDVLETCCGSNLQSRFNSQCCQSTVLLSIKTDWSIKPCMIVFAVKIPVDFVKSQRLVPISFDPSFYSVLYPYIDIINTFVRSIWLVFTLLCNDQIFEIFNRARIQFWALCCVM